jgi:hypothetical protein
MHKECKDQKLKFKAHKYHQMTKKQMKKEQFEKIESLWKMLNKNQARQLIWTIKEWKLNLLLDFVAWRWN